MPTFSFGRALRPTFISLEVTTMEYLLLWSGDVRGMKKARIGHVLAEGVLCDYDAASNHPVAPDRVAVRAALPYRLRKAFDRNPSWTRQRDVENAPWTVALHTTRGKWITTLYLQPLTKG
jgi:hypothetical protein